MSKLTLHAFQVLIARLTGSTAGQGDIGQYLAGEALGGTSAALGGKALPQIAATWTMSRTRRSGMRERKVVRARGCSAEDLKRFFKAFLEALKPSDAQEYHDGPSFGFHTSSGHYHFFDHATGFAVCVPAALFVVLTRPRGPLLFIEHGLRESGSATQPFPQIVGKGYYAHMSVPRSDHALLWFSVVAALSAACLPAAIRLHLGGLFKALGIVGLFFGPALLGLSILESSRYGRTWRVLLAIVISFIATAIGWGTTILFALGKFP